MSRRGASSPRIRQEGLTLIELMVAMVLALLVMASVGAVYLIASRNLTQQDAESRLQQSSAAALAIVTRQLQKAGFVDMPPEWQGWKSSLQPGEDHFAFLMRNITQSSGQRSLASTVHGCDAGYVDTADLDSLECRPANDDAPAAITLAWQLYRTGESDSARPWVSGCATDLGRRFEIPTNGSVNDLFYLDAQGDRQPVRTYWTLCRISLDKANSSLLFIQNPRDGATTPMTLPMIDDVADLQFKYLTAADGRRQRVARDSDSAAGVTTWSEVTGVEVCLLMRVRVGNPPPAGSTYKDCKGREQSHTDAFLYRAVSGVVALRSRVPHGTASIFP